jgi:hypothetical protein
VRIWNISAGNDGYSLVLEDVKPCAVFTDWAWDRVCGLTGGRLGGHNLGNWAWKLPLGKPDYDRSDPDDPWLTNSLAGGLMDLENWVFKVGYGSEHIVDRVPLTHDQAMKISPQFTAEFDSLEDPEAAE